MKRILDFIVAQIDVQFLLRPRTITICSRPTTRN
jgi:hypothetical protein